MTMLSRVRGFRLLRADRLLVENVPNSGRETVSPFTRAPLLVSRSAFTACSARSSTGSRGLRHGLRYPISLFPVPFQTVSYATRRMRKERDGTVLCRRIACRASVPESPGREPAGVREPGRRGRAAPAFPSALSPEAQPMNNRNPSRYTRALVLAGPGAALLATICSLAAGSGLRLLGAVWACAALWSLLTALPCVLWRGFRHGDWSAFARYELPDGREERFEWSSRTGRYAWRRDDEERELHGHDPDFPFP